MNIIDVFDLLPNSMGEKTKEKISVWILISLLFIFIARSLYSINGLNEKVDIQTQELGTQNNIINALHKGVDSLRRNDSLIISNENNKSEEQKRINRILSTELRNTIIILARRDSIDRAKDKQYDSDREAWDESFKKNEERKRKWDQENPQFAPDH